MAMGSQLWGEDPIWGEDPFTIPLDIDALFAQISDDCNMEDLLWLDEYAAPDPQLAGHIVSPPAPQSAGDAGAENLPEQNADPWFDWTWTSPGLTLIQPSTCSIGNAAGRFAGTGMAEIPHSWSPLSGFNFNLREINAVLNPTAAVEDILSAENPPREPTPLLGNADLALPEPEPGPDPYSTGDSSCPSTTADMGMGISSSPDLEVNAGARLLPSGGGALTEAPVRVSCKRKGLVCGSSSQRSTPPEFNLELFSGRGSRYRPPPPIARPPRPLRRRESDIKPPTGSTDHEIIHFLRQQEISMAQGDLVNLNLAWEDLIMAPNAVRSYVTTVGMVPDRHNYYGYWKENQVKPLGEDESDGLFWQGLKRTFQFHRYDGTKTNWFMHEYIPTDVWGSDLYMKGLRFREVYEGAAVPVHGEPTPPEVKIKNKTAAAKKHRMRGPENLVIKGESPAWQHFIKIYDRHPELEGSKVVYAVCCHCEAVLKAGTENGTKSLLTHCDRTCPVKNKKQQPSSSSSNSTGDTSCLSTAADTGSSSLDQDFNAGAGLPQSGGGGGGGGGCTLAEVSCKRKKLVCGSSSQRSVPPEFNLVELLAGLVQSDPSYRDVKPPTGSTDREILRFLRREEGRSMPHGMEASLNLSLGEQDQMAPKAVRSYVTTVQMIPDQETHLGHWKEKQARLLCDGKGGGISAIIANYYGVKRTFQFHRYDSTKTNWFMDEYIPTDHWGRDLYMERLRFREVYEGAEVPVPGEPTSQEEKIKNKIAVAKKHRMRGPQNMVIKGESPAWQHFIKVYDRYPELEGSKVVYAVCCHCEGVLKAGTDNGTKSLLTHCNRTCPVKNKKQQPSSSSYQENLFGVP